MSELPRLEGRWRELKDRAVFRLTGADRIRYLNGQVTNDVAKVSEGRALPACLCTIKGKVEALVWIRAQGDGIFVDGEGIQREALAARLERYLIADDCEIEDLTGQVRLFHHFAGESVGGAVSTRLGEPGHDWIGENGVTLPFAAGGEISDADWELREILSMVPRSGTEIHSDEFPAELGLDATAVDFHKGCYLGQEVISRIRSVGRVKRFLRIVEAGRPLESGEEVIAPSGEKGKVTRPSQPWTAGRSLTLAFFQVPSLESPLLGADVVKIA